MPLTKSVRLKRWSSLEEHWERFSKPNGTRDPKADRPAYSFVSLEVDFSLNDEHISYPLLHYKPPHTWWLKTTTFFFLVHKSVGQLGSSLGM